LNRVEKKQETYAEQGSWIANAARNDLISILDKLPCGVAILGSSFGNALYINDKIIATLGYSLNEVPSTRAMMKRAIPDRKARREAHRSWKEAIRSGVGTTPVVREYLCADGVCRTFEHRAVMLRKNLFVNLWIDVTRREVAEAKLRESEARFRSFFEDSSDPFLLMDGDLIADCNQASFEVFGVHEKEEVVGSAATDLLPGRWSDSTPSSLRAGSPFRTALKKGRYRCEWTARRIDGKEFPVELSITAINLEGKTLLLVLLRDITEWKEVQHALLSAKKDLERRVRERTEDLALLNKQLLREISVRKKSEMDLRKSREELRNLSEYLQLIREEDKAYIAREVHDELGQALSAAAVDLAYLRGRLSGEQSEWLREQIQEIEARISDAVQSVREICRKLRPPILDDLGLSTAIKWHLTQFQEKTGICCAAAISEEEPDPPKEVCPVIFRIYQEAMTNVFRHAEATTVNVSLKRYKTHIILTVKDNGKGISVEQISSPSSLGILGIRERTRFWGGKLLLTGEPGMGTMLKVSIPFKQRKRPFKKLSLRSL